MSNINKLIDELKHPANEGQASWKLAVIAENNMKKMEELEQKINELTLLLGKTNNKIDTIKNEIPKNNLFNIRKYNGEFKPMIINLNLQNIEFKLCFLRDQHNYNSYISNDNVLICLINEYQLFDLNTDLSNNQIIDYLGQFNNSTIVFNLNDRNCGKFKNNYFPHRNDIKEILEPLIVDKNIVINAIQETMKLKICQEIINYLATNNKMKKIEINLKDNFIINTTVFYSDTNLNKLKKHCVDNNVELITNIGL
jgi:hypothetical protein